MNGRVFESGIDQQQIQTKNFKQNLPFLPLDFFNCKFCAKPGTAIVGFFAPPSPNFSSDVFSLFFPERKKVQVLRIFIKKSYSYFYIFHFRIRIMGFKKFTKTPNTLWSAFSDFAPTSFFFFPPFLELPRTPTTINQKTPNPKITNTSKTNTNLPS